MSNYDVLIIGGGPGGYNAAIRAGQLDTWDFQWWLF